MSHQGHGGPPWGGGPPVDSFDRNRAREQVKANLLGHTPQATHIGRYVVDHLMGRGATGVVYRAHDPQLGRHVALKVLDASVAQDEATRERLTREARALAGLSHPNVVVIFEIGVHDGRLFLAMELLEGGTLGQWVRATPRDWRATLRVLVGAGRGLEAAHQRGFLHRDLKPDNVLVGSDGRPRVVDFGLVGHHGLVHGTPVHQLPGHLPADAMTLTATGALLGTPAYMAPEQLMGEPASAFSDQFAFCATAYEALFDQRPFQAGNLIEQVHAVTNGHVQPPPKNRGVPPAVTKALLKGLSVAPQQRHPSMTTLLATLESSLRSRGAVVAGVIGALAAATIAAGAGWWWYSTSDTAVSEHTAEQRRLLTRREFEECIDIAERYPSEPTMLLGLVCAEYEGGADRFRELCKIWTKEKLTGPVGDRCVPAVYELIDLMSERRYGDCLDRALEEDDSQIMLEYRIKCGRNSRRTHETEEACRTLIDEYPKSFEADNCKFVLNPIEALDP